MIFMNKLGMSILITGLILLSYGIKERDHVKTEDIASYICLSCLGLAPESANEIESLEILENDLKILNSELERTNHKVEIIVFSQKNCKPCPKAIATAKEIAESSEFISWSVVELEKDPEMFEKYRIKGTPTTIVLIDDKEKFRFERPLNKLKLVKRIEKSIEE